MIRKSLIRQITKFCSGKQGIEQSQSKFLTEAEKKFDKTPLHLQVYDKKKYEVPLKNIKKNSGYSMVQIEPFPRARIMKICYNLLAELRKGIPETDYFRIFNEERLKYVMQLTDKEEDIAELQRLFSITSIQIFIRNLANQFEVIDAYRALQPWKMTKEDKDQIDQEFVKEFGQKAEQKYPAYRRPERVRTRLI